MPTLTIDNRAVTVAEGATVLQAAVQLGIVIPHFCYHEALGAVGACRLCAVTFVDGPVKGVLMSCMVEAQDGMVVSTLDPEAQELRRHVIEWLMTNHPHDCPVCDEGGECQLQDMTIAGGHSIRRYRGPKRTYQNQQLGPFIEQEMNRCIACYRCVRTYQDYCGGKDFGVMGSRNRLFFGRFLEGRLQSPFSGNLVDVCPTGVFTDKTFRFKTRYWDLEEAPSVCPHCSLGCSTVPGGRHRELQRVRAGVNRQTNGFFICDRGRFGYGHVNDPQRPRSPKVDGRQVAWPDALEAAAERLSAVIAAHGPASVAFVASSRSSLEAAWMLRRWAGKLAAGPVCYDVDPRRDRTARVAASLPRRSVAGLEDIRQADLILLAGADPLAEGPVLALAMRQAGLGGATVAVLDPRPVELPCEASHLPLSPEEVIRALKALATGDFDRFDRPQAQFLEGVRVRLEQASRPVLVGGGDLLGPEGAAALKEVAAAWSTEHRDCRATVLLGGPGSFGGGMLAADGPDFAQAVSGIKRGEIKALVSLEADPLSDFPEPALAAEALEKLELLVCIDSAQGRTLERADIVLPSRAVAESCGTFVNHEGRMLRFEPVIEPGLPMQVTGGGSHPPRDFQLQTPGGQPMAAWAVLGALQQHECRLAELWCQMESGDPRLAGISALQAEGEGCRVVAAASLPGPGGQPGEVAARPLRLLATESLFGSEKLSCLSPPLQGLASPVALLHRRDGIALGLADGQSVWLEAPAGRAKVQLLLSDKMAPGLVIVPRLRGTKLESFAPGTLQACRLHGEGEHE